jgi:DNA-binding NtrC family response regulator
MSAYFNVFIVEDDEWYLRMLEYHIKMNPDNEVHSFTSGKELIKNLNKRPDLITLDYSLGDENANDIVQQVKNFDSDIPIVIISGQEDVNTAVDLLRKGVYDYIVKNEDTKDRIWNIIKHLKQNVDLKEELNLLREEVAHKYDFSSSMVGDSAAMHKVFKLMEKALKTNITVSITGETGTGKEMVAKGIHYNSKRSKGPFVAVNMAAIPSELIESELFGHEKGSFTGANIQRIGKFEEAQNGTIFLDEIGDLDLNLQSKLLRVLQEKEVTRVGGNKSIPIDVRVIVATHKDLSEEVEKGRFREDLFYRLLGLPIKLPPLSSRVNDIILLAKFFLKEFAKENDLAVLSLSPDAVKKLMAYNYPGNVRELKAIIELAAVMCDGTLIEPDDIIFSPKKPMANLMLEEKSLRKYTFDIIKYYREKYDDNIIKVAEVLDVGKSTIYRMLKEMKEDEEKYN